MLKKHFTDLWKIKSCPICPEKINYDYNREDFKGKRRMLLLAFLLSEKRLLMAEPKTIYCPKCGRKVATWDGRSKNNVSSKCSKCRKLVVYDTETKEVKLMKVPPRIASSGMRFY